MSTRAVAAPVSAKLLKANRYTDVTSAAFDVDKVWLRSATGVERLGEPFTIEVIVASEDRIANFGQVPGNSLTIALELQKGVDGIKRYFNGIVTSFEYIGLDKSRFPNYRAEIRPWLALLERRQNFRIFQHQTSIEIIETIFREYNGDFKIRVHSRPPSRIYCVQYGETDLDFVSRLMEQDGIYYYFDHLKDKHELNLVDSPSSHPNCDPNSIQTHLDKNRQLDDVFWEWRETGLLQPEKIVLDDYDHEKPRVRLKSPERVRPVPTGGVPIAGSLSPPTASAHAAMKPDMMKPSSAGLGEVFTFPGRYTKPQDGQFYAAVRAEEIACAAYRVHVEGAVRQVRTGSVFEAANPFDIAAQERAPAPNERYLAVAVAFSIVGEVPDRDDDDTEPFRLYRSVVEAQPAKTQYRSPQRTPSPKVAGPQTAVVVGPPGATVHTDQYGRVKVQFFWDRVGRSNESSSCWVRVSQSWAGKEYGALVTPRIGQEVVVSFIHGNPDWPLVTGAVYNEQNMPPERLPLHATRSTFKTRSTAGMNAYNELRFEDQRDAEEVYLRAQKDFNVDVGQTHTVNVRERYSLVSPSTFMPGGGDSPAGAVTSRIDVTPGRITFTVGATSIVMTPETILLTAPAVISVESLGAVSVQSAGDTNIAAGALLTAEAVGAVQITGSVVNLTAADGAITCEPFPV